MKSDKSLYAVTLGFTAISVSLISTLFFRDKKNRKKQSAKRRACMARHPSSQDKP